jgi:hypothetical protein
MALEATSGPYWDDDNHMLFERNGLPYDYFGFNEYPAIEVWAYFNDAYYFNTSTGEGNAPAHWRTFWQSSRFDWMMMSLLIVLVGSLVALITLIVSIVHKRKKF